MYFPIGWPKVLKLPELGRSSIKQVTCNREKILFAILTDDTVSIWFCKPCVPIVFHRRDSHSVEKFGSNLLLEWKPDSSMFVIVTSEGHLLFYNVDVLTDQKGLYVQTDPPHESLKRDSAELFIKEIIPPLHLSLKEEVQVWDGEITGVVCITMAEFMISTKKAHVLRYKWDGTQNRDYALDLRRIPFCINQQVSKAVPIVEENVYISCMEYSPLVGGFAIVLNDGRAAFLTASSLKFDPNQVQGIWAQGIEDATYASVNHKYRLIAFGRANSECVVYYVDESTGGLEVSHHCVLSSKDYPGCPGAVRQIKWTPDGCAMAVTWDKGGLTLWSTFGALLMCSLGWDYGLHVDLEKENPLHITSMEFSTEGYELWMVRKLCNEKNESDNDNNSNKNDTQSHSVVQLGFVKSALTTNPCMSHNSHLYLQGDDKLYVNTVDTLRKFFSDRSEGCFGENNPSMLTEGRQWLIITTPSTYSATNWPIRYSAIDYEGQNVAVAGRTGLAHYCIATRRWQLFGNETQEKDFIVTGGLLWWKDYIIMGCYSIIDNRDEIRFYPKECKLDNKFAKIIKVNASILLVNALYDQLITFGSDAQVAIWSINRIDKVGNVDMTKIQAIDISALCVHPACVTSVTLTCLRTESGRNQNMNSENIVLNVSGRLLLVQRESRNGDRYTCSMPTVLASCVENVWVPLRRKAEKVHLTEALWLFCGAHGMRVWLPLFPKDGDKTHTFMSKRIMLPFNLRIYPLAILFEDAIILGGENDTTLYTSDSNSPFSLPFNFLGRTSQVYLHQILRQLIRRNLGFHAWEIARSCNNLPYFPHSLELLLHEVLDEEATSKEPIPDAQLPSVIEFIMEFPVYLQTVVQCARKTEIALWPYLFSAAGKPKDLFQECMAKKQLDTAASYLIILQNLETSSVSRQYATLLLDTALDKLKWELARELVRFLRAIDPNDVESPRNSFILPSKLAFSQTAPVSPNAEDLSLILGNVQTSRCRSFSTTVTPKFPENKHPTNANNSADSPVLIARKSISSAINIKNENKDGTAEEFFIDVILQRHARRLLSSHRLSDLGYFAAHLDFHLVTWLAREKDRAARVDDFVTALKSLHQDFNWPYPTALNLPRTSISSVHSSLDSPVINLDDRIKALHIDTTNGNQTSSRIGDSGYMSFPGGLPCTGLLTSMNNAENFSQISESDIDDQSEMTQVEVEDASLPNNVLRSKLEESNMSITSSAWGLDNDSINMISENWDVPHQVLEQLSNCGTKGSQRDEVRLRYLLQLFLEASCLEWSLIISILLRDAMAVIRTVNTARTSDQSIEALSRLKQGLQMLFNWTSRECLGYKSFMLAIQSQISVLGKILTTKIQQQQIQDHQQAVSATFSKMSAFASSKGRKISTSIESCSQSGSKEMVSSNKGSLSSNEKTETLNTPSSQKENEDYSPPSSIIPESTGCTVS